MQKLVWQNLEGDELDLTSGNYGITEWEGFSNAGLNIQSQQVPFQDGAVFLDALIEPRELSVTLAMQDNNNLELRYQLRRELIHKLNPKLGEGYLIYTNDFISKRIKCVPHIPLFPTKNSNDPGTPKASLAWTACEPYFEDLEETIATLTIESPTTIRNNGDVSCQLKMLVGVSDSCSNLSIMKINNNKHIQYNGDIRNPILINTNIGNKSVTEREIKNILKNNKTDISAFIYSEYMKKFVVSLQGGGILTSENGIDFLYTKTNVTFNNLVASTKENLLIGFSGASIYTSQDGINWTYRAKPTNYVINDSVYDERADMFIAVGNNGTVLSSTNGETWTVRNFPITENLNAIIFYYTSPTSKTYVVGGNNGTIYYSAGSLNSWNNLNLTASINIKSIAYTGTSLIVVGEQGMIYTFNPPYEWVQQDSGVLENLNSIVYLNFYRKIIIVGDNGTILYSQDGINWEKDNTLEITSNIKNIKYYNSKANFYFIYDKFLCSMTIGGNVDNLILNMFGDDSLYILGETDETIILGKYVSTDGMNWDYIQQLPANSNSSGFAFSKKLNKCVICSTNSTIYYSNDKGYSWSAVYFLSENFTDVCYNENIGIFVATARDIYYSFDGVNWNPCNVVFENNRFHGVITSEKNNNFIVYGTTKTLRSEDGINWVEIENVTKGLSGIYAEEINTYLIFSSDGYVYKSSDAITWNKYIPSGTANILLQDIIYSNEDGYFIGATGIALFISADGITWTKKIDGIGKEVIYSNIYKNIIFTTSQGGLFELKNILTQNIIQNITTDSDINFNLEQGDNILKLNYDAGCAIVVLKYRQKYIGV